MAVLEREITGIDDIADKVYDGRRLSWDDGRRLIHHHNLPELGALVNRMTLSTEAPAWEFGAGALMRNLARRGLL